MSYFNDPNLNPMQGQVGMGRPVSAIEMAKKQVEVDHAERTYSLYAMMQQVETMRRAAQNYDQQRLAEIFDEAVEILNVEWNKARKR